MTLAARLDVRVTVFPQLMRTSAAAAAAVTEKVADWGAQTCRLEADSAVIVTVAAMGAINTRPVGLEAVTVTFREERMLDGRPFGCVHAGWVIGEQRTGRMSAELPGLSLGMVSAARLREQAGGSPIIRIGWGSYIHGRRARPCLMRAGCI